MCETFNVNGCYIAIQSVLSWYYNGRETWIIIDSGYDKTHILHIYENCVLKQGVGKLNIAGKDLTEYKIKILTERRY